MLSLSIASFFEGVIYAFTTIFDFIGDLLNDVLFVVENVGNAIHNLPTYLAFLPASVVSLFMSGAAIIIVYKILGRD